MTARDPRTGAGLTEAGWQRSMADFMVQLRAALPATEIVHDVLWYMGDAGTDIGRELAAADVVAIEQGFNDPAIVGGAGPRGWQTLAGFVERRQAGGGGVVLDGYADAAAGRLYGLANALLLDTGRTAIGNDAWTAPNRFWAGYTVDLGAPASARTAWNGLWRRDFAGGLVLVNEPGAAPRTATLGAGYTDLDGVAISSISLAPGTGAVLKRLPAAAPDPVSAPVAPPVPVAPPKPPRKPIRRASGTSAHTAGARTPKETTTTVDVSRLSVFGRVRGAVSGYVRVGVQRKRGGRWVTARRAKATVSKGGTFKCAIPRLAKGRYRVSAFFEGTGTARPSRSGFELRAL